MFFAFRSDATNFRPHIHKRRHLYKLHIRHVGHSSTTFVTLAPTPTLTLTLVAVALLNFQTHAKLNPRMCLTFALFWLSGPWVFSHEPVLVSSMLSTHMWVCVHSNLSVRVRVYDCVCECVLFSSPFIRHFFLASFTTQLSRSNSRRKTRDSRLDTAVAFRFDTLFLFILSTLQKKAKISTFTTRSNAFLPSCFLSAFLLFFWKNKQIIKCTAKRQMKTC